MKSVRRREHFLPLTGRDYDGGSRFLFLLLKKQQHVKTPHTHTHSSGCLCVSHNAPGAADSRPSSLTFALAGRRRLLVQVSPSLAPPPPPPCHPFCPATPPIPSALSCGPGRWELELCGRFARQYSLNSLYGPKQAAALFSSRAVNCTLSRQH